MKQDDKSDQRNLQAPCPRCGAMVDVIFKFCPLCGLEMKPRVDVASSDIISGEKLPELSPKAQQALIEFEKQFALLQTKTKDSPKIKLAESDPAIVKLAVVLIALTILGVIGCAIYLGRYLSHFINR
jgi:hypothetical protein